MTKNLTLALDDTLLRRARVYAAERGTTVNALVRDHLEALVTGSGTAPNASDTDARLADARAKLRILMDRSVGAEDGRPLSRDEIYADRLFPRHEHPRVRGGLQEE